MVTSEVRIGCVLPLTGSMSELAENCRRGYAVAVEECNENGGIRSLGNAKVLYEYVDCGDRPEGAISECERLINKGNVVGIVGCYGSSLTLAAAQVAEKHKFPFMVANATANELTESGFRYVFRACPTDTIEVNAAIDFGMKVLKAKTLGVVYVDAGWGKVAVSAVKKRAEQVGLRIVFVAHYDVTSRNLSKIISKLNSFSPDLVVAASFINDAVLMAHQMRQQDCNVRAFVGLGAGYATPAFLKNAGNDAEYFASVVSWCYDMSTHGSKEFVERYTQEYGEQPLEHSASAFQASTVLSDALEKARSTDPEKISKALRETDMMTICGPVKIDPQTGQNSLAQSMIIQVQNGQFATIWPDEVASKEPVFPIPRRKKRQRLRQDCSKRD